MYKKLGLLVISAILFSSNSVLAEGLICETRNADCGDIYPVEIFSMFDNQNSHAALPGVGDYQWKVCCGGVTNLGNSCSGVEGIDLDYMLFLANPDNAHVQWADTFEEAIPPYVNNPACMSVDAGAVEVQCQYLDGEQYPDQTCDQVFGEGYACVTTVRGPDNSHVAACDGPLPYDNKICCKAISDIWGPELTFVLPTPPEGAGWPHDWVPINVSSNEDLQPGTCMIQVTRVGFPPAVNLTPDDQGDRSCFKNVTSLSPGLPDGAYIFQAYAEDPFGNGGWSVERSLSVLTDPPNSVITAPADEGIYNQSSWEEINPIQGTATDGQNGIKTVEVSVQRASDGWCWNGAGWDGNCPNWQLAGGFTQGENNVMWTYDFTATEMAYTIQSQATDMTDIVEPLPDQVGGIVDLTPPDIVLDPGPGSTGNPNPEYSGTATDPDPNNNLAVSGVAKIQYRVEHFFNNNWIVTTSWTDIYEGPPAEEVFFQFTPTLMLGNNRISVQAIDDAGNYGNIVSDEVFYDEELPYSVIQAPTFVNSPYDDLGWENDDPIRGIASDDNGVASVEISIRRTSDSMYWNGASWVPGEVWILTFLGSPNQPFTSWRWPETEDYIPADGEYQIRSQATDIDDPANTEIPDAGQVVILDSNLPQAWFDSPIDGSWTNTDYIEVTWSGSDAGGIVSFFIEYKDVTAGTGWVPLLPIVEEPGSVNLTDVLNNHLYSFRVTATDIAGNQNNPDNTIVTTGVDLVAPVCTITPFDPPPFRANPVTIEWSVEEEESGVDDMNLYISQESPDNWQNANDFGGGGLCVPPVDGTFNFTDCTFPLETLYYFMCSATDVAGNVGENSSEESITVDNTRPDGQITEPSTPWTNTVPFTLAWEFFDPGGIDHYIVQWSSSNFGNIWMNLTYQNDENIPAGVTSLQFGSGSYSDPGFGQINDGYTFSFQAQAWDAAGNNVWSPLVETTIDTTPPTANVSAQDEKGNEVNNTNFGEVTEIFIISEAADPLPGSGIASHTLWIQRTEEGIFLESHDCGDMEVCEWPEPIPVSEADEIVYWAEVEDQAGNRFVTLPVALSVHPLANFVVHDVALLLGSFYVLDVQIRNLEQVPLAYVELNLSPSGYQLAGFIGGSGEFSGEPVISNNGRSIAITDLQAGGEGLLKIQLAASEPGVSADLIMDARGKESPEGPFTVFDEDIVHIRVEFPPSFSGLSEWAVLVLLGIAVLGYVVVRRRD